MEKIFTFFLIIFPVIIFSQIVLKDGYVYKNGKFEKLDILIKGEKIIKVGKDIKGKEEESLRDLYIYPGFFDSHLHVYGIGKEMEIVNLKGCKSMEEIIERIKEKYPSIKKDKWIIGRGWDQNLFELKKLPDNKLISEVFKENPVVLYRVDGHMLLANKRAIEIAKVEDLKEIEGGEVDKEKGLYSDKAMEPFLDAMPVENIKEIEITLKKSFDYLKSSGFVAVSDAGIDLNVLKAYLSLSRKREIPIIVYAMLDANIPDLEEVLKNGPINEKNFKLDTLKIFMDGALGSWGAYLSIPYKDRPSSKGILVTPYENLLNILKLCKKYNFKAAIHSIGDEATTIAIKAIEKAGMKKGYVRLEHLQLLKQEDLKKMKNLKIFASLQPYHYISDLKFLYDRLDKNISLLLYPWRSFLNNGIKILFGSDSPVESANFLEGYFAAIERENEGIKAEEAILAYTLNGFIFYGEEKMGRIEKGYYANFTVLNKNILKEKENIKVCGTMVKGKWVYRE